MRKTLPGRSLRCRPLTPCVRSAGELRFDPQTRETSGIYHLCGGSVRGSVRCLGCGGVSHRYESFLTFPLEVSGRHINSVQQALAANFCTSEELSAKLGNAYQCDACAGLVTARRSARLALPPNILILALKRYQPGIFGKINKTVSYPALLDLAPYMPQPLQPPPAAADPDSSPPAESPSTPPATEEEPSAPAPAADAAPASPPAEEMEDAETEEEEEGAAAAAEDALPPPPPSAPSLPPRPYRLFGVVVHLDWALSVGSGHYICYVRRGEGWWKCDDSHV